MIYICCFNLTFSVRRVFELSSYNVFGDDEAEFCMTPFDDLNELEIANCKELIQCSHWVWESAWSKCELKKNTDILCEWLRLDLYLFGESISKTNRRSLSFAGRTVHKRKSGTMIDWGVCDCDELSFDEFPLWRFIYNSWPSRIVNHRLKWAEIPSCVFSLTNYIPAPCFKFIMRSFEKITFKMHSKSKHNRLFCKFYLLWSAPRQV